MFINSVIDFPDLHKQHLNPFTLHSTISRFTLTNHHNIFIFVWFFLSSKKLTTTRFKEEIQIIRFKNNHHNIKSPPSLTQITTTKLSPLPSSVHTKPPSPPPSVRHKPPLTLHTLIISFIEIHECKSTTIVSCCFFSYESINH